MPACTRRPSLALLLAALCGCLAATPASAAAPEAAIPFAARAVHLDGVIAPGEWADAAVVRSVWVMGGSELARPRTEFLLKYDGDALWVAARCTEPDAAYPRAHRRSPTDLLSNDDSVQVVLGISKSLAPKPSINYGGYAGASNQPACAADVYYQFTANSAGAIARAYIESPLPRPLFAARSRVARGKWAVEMRIPFASWGLTDPEGRSVPANLFRFRPPSMTAWHLPAFGNYAPMPFGTFRFLPRAQRAGRTVEPVPALPPASLKRSDTVTASIEWYPLADRVIARVPSPLPAGAMRAALSAGDQRVERIARAGAWLTLKPAGGAAPDRARFTLLNARREALDTRECAITRAALPAWHATHAGEAYLTGKVPSPWRAPVIAGRTVRLAHTAITFGPNGLPASVRDATGKTLAAPAAVEIAIRGRVQPPLGAACRVTRSGLRALVEGVTRYRGFRVETRSLVEFDGFTLTKMRVLGAPPRSIDRLALVFPMRPEAARFLNRGHLQDTREIDRFGCGGPAGPVWLGGHDRGLAFTYDTGPFLSTDTRRQVEAAPRGGAVMLRLTLVDRAGQIARDGHVFRFFLQPTPTRRPSLAKSGLYGGGTDLWFENWSDYQGYPDLDKMPEVLRRANESHRGGRKLIVYFDQLLAENAPGFLEHRRGFTLHPEQMWYQRAYDPGKGVRCYVCCANGPYGDLLLDGIQRLADEGKIDGVYMDGTTVPWDCANPSHPGCGVRDPATWLGEEPTRIVSVRRFLKRLRGIFDERGKPYTLVAHCGGDLDIPTLSFADVYYEGEQLARYRPDYAMPVHKFAVGYSGWALGFRTDMIAVLWGDDTARILPWSLLHDTEVGLKAGPLEQRIYEGFSDDATVEYRPYWRPQPHVRRVRGDVLYSYYLRRGSATLVVSNLTWSDQDCVLDVRGTLPAQAIAAEDIATGRPVEVAAGRIRLRLPPHGFAALRLAPSGKLPATAPPPPASGPAPVAVDGGVRHPVL